MLGHLAPFATMVIPQWGHIAGFPSHLSSQQLVKCSCCPEIVIESSRILMFSNDSASASCEVQSVKILSNLR
jgi:hypothetical protein